jgi:periplasmic protein TonB
MFGETLLESSAGRKRKRWPMATAFTVQTLVAVIVVIVPLLSTGVIPLSARVPIFTPLDAPETPKHKPVPDHPAHGPAAPSGPVAVILDNHNHNTIYIGKAVERTDKEEEVQPGPRFVADNKMPANLFERGNGSGTDVKPEQKRRSVLLEAQVISRVEPVYPRIAVASGVQGQVKLHAIIARNGKIESLELISGHPLLVQAAMDAVRQWRYRPYYLNGEAVEVETFITVNFRREGR